MRSLALLLRSILRQLRLIPAAPMLISRWLPQGKRVGNEWVATNPTRADSRPGSFKINLLTGVWADFATGETGGDMMDLHQYLFGGDPLNAAKEVRHPWCGSLIECYASSDSFAQRLCTTAVRCHLTGAELL